MKKDSLIEVFNKNRGYASSKELNRHRVYPRDIRNALDNGIIERIKQGFYRLPGIELNENSPLVDACLAVPHGVICLFSALSFHGMSTQNPAFIDVAIPNKAKKINIFHPPVVFHYFRSTSYSLGITKVKIAGKEIRVYNKEKTVCDCFKNINYITEEVALEALKDYSKIKNRNYNRLVEYAKVCKVYNKISDYLKIITV